MKKWIFFMVWMSSCSQTTNNKPVEPPGQEIKPRAIPHSPLSSSKHLKYKDAEAVLADTNLLYRWFSDQGYPELAFSWQKDSAAFMFNGQCMYVYPVKAKNKTITVYWDMVENCTHLTGIRKKFRIKTAPIKGQPFMTLTLINDSTLESAYLFPEWTDSVNACYIDYPYFPAKFHSYIE